MRLVTTAQYSTEAATSDVKVAMYDHVMNTFNIWLEFGRRQRVTVMCQLLLVQCRKTALFGL